MVPNLLTLWIQAIGGLFLLLTCCALYASRRRPYFLWWTAAWFFLSAAQVLHTLERHLELSWLGLGAALGLVWHCIGWVRGVQRFRERPGLSRSCGPARPGSARSLAGLAGAFVGAALVAALARHFLPRSIGNLLFSAGLATVWAWSLAAFLRLGLARAAPGVRVLVGFLGLCIFAQFHHLAVQCWVLTAARPIASLEYLRWVPLADSLLQALLVLGTLLILFDEEQNSVRQVLERLGESEGRFRMVFEHGGVGMALLTPDGRCVEVNPALERMLGYTTADLRGRRLADFAHPEEGTTRFHIDQLAESVHTQDERERRYLHKDGRTVWAHLLRVHVRNAAGQKDHAVSVLVDITARRHAEETLRAERDFSSQVLQTADALILVMDPAGAIVRFNGKCAAVSGYSQTDAQGRVLWDFLLSPNSVGPVQEAFERLLASPSPCVLECAWKTRTGEERLIAWRFSSVRDEEGYIQYVIGAGLDITDQRRLEEQLRHAQKMETLGTLVGGIAHDFNNQLTAILGNVGLVLMELTEVANLRLQNGNLSPPMQTTLATLQTLLVPLADAENAAQRCADMSRRLLAFSRTRIGQTQPLNLNDLLTEVTRLLQRVLPATIHVHVETDPDLALIKADSTQLHQILMNLAVNARDAMPHGGTLTLQTSNCVLTTADCTRNVEARPGRFVVLRVTDTGCGISADVLARIFEPFFTTKEADKGTGLGLAMVFGTVKAHRGWIVVDSQPGEGTAFAVYLPALGSDCRTKEGNTPQRNLAALTQVHTGCILVVDDEQLIRNYTSCLLERVGYQVLSAGDGEEALGVYAQHAEKIDAIILDLTMPRMTGHETLERLRAINPEVRVVFTSGYAPQKETEQLLAVGPGAFVAKPYQPQELLRVLRTVLERKPGRALSKHGI